MTKSWVSVPVGDVVGQLQVPGDKSISHRALLFNALACGEAEIRNLLEGEDCLCTLEALRQMGVQIDRAGAGHYLLAGAGNMGLSDPAAPLDMGNSGTAMRLFSGVLAGQRFASTLIGDASLSRRPMARIIRPLSAMGAIISGKGNRPPLTIEPAAELLPIRYGMPVASAQVKSAILLAGLSCDGITQVSEPAPTRDHSERMLGAMGAAIEVDDLLITLRGPTRLEAVNIDVPSDLSAAAFFLVAAAISEKAEVRIQRVGINPTRTGIIDALRLLGAEIIVENVTEIGGEPVADLVVSGAGLQGTSIPAEIAPLAIDEYPVLFVAAACATGVTHFAGIGELRHKESDRIKAMINGLRSLGVQCESTDDSATITGGSIGAGSVHSCGDHRIAMAFAVAGSVAAAPVQIQDVGPVETSFPDFPDYCRQIGLDVRPAP